MPVGRFTARLSDDPKPIDYVLAAGFVALALLVRGGLATLSAGVAYFIVILPAVVVAGVFCGTRPAAVAAALGLAGTAVLFGRQQLLVWPPATSLQLNALLFALACGAALFATSTLRRFAARAAAAEAGLAEVFRQIPAAAAILEAPDGRLLLRSTQSQDILGKLEAHVERSGDLAAYGGLHPDGRSFAADDYPIVRALKQGEVVRGERFRYRQPNGRIVDLEVHAGPVRNPQGRIVAAVGTAFDVSERVQAERRLADSEAEHRALSQRLRAAVEAGALGLWEIDLATQRIHLDAALAAMLGLPPEPVEMARTDMHRFIDPTDRARAIEAFTGSVAEGRDYADEVRMVTARNCPRWFVMRSAVLADQRKVVGVARDVTHRRQREDALREALEAREILMREADHRIKNSLQLVVSLLQLQLGRVADPDARHALRAAVSRVTAVADAHLALQQSPDLRSLDIDRMLEDLCGRVGSLNPALTVRCSTQVGRELDAERAIPLGLIVSEILTNALRHAYPPGAAGHVTLTARAHGDGVEVTVEDGGRGLPDPPPRPGLGSTVIATLARQIGAGITSDSAPGRGTRVTVRLPLAAAEESSAADAPTLEPASSGPA